MAKVAFTAPKVIGFTCPTDKEQAFMKFLRNNCLYCANVCDKVKAAGKSTSCKRTAAHMAQTP